VVKVGTLHQPLFGYAGQYTDTETGLQWLRARYYDPTTAQFLTVDPLAAITGARYSYAGCNPITRTDPTGLWSSRTWITIGLVLGGVALIATGVGLFGGAAAIGAAIGVSTEAAGFGLAVTAAATRTAAVAIDKPACVDRHDPAACGGMIMGGMGAAAGLGSVGLEGAGLLAGGMTDGMEEVDTALQLGGLLFGGAGPRSMPSGPARAKDAVRDELQGVDAHSGPIAVGHGHS
jgi:RHS repeat-associated protein